MMEEAITALLVSVAGGRRWWGRAPQTISATTGPYIVLSCVSGVGDYHAQGRSRHVESRVQADVYAASYTAAKTTARQVSKVLGGARTGNLQGIFLDQERDLPDEDAGAVQGLFCVSLDFIVHHTEI